MSEPNDPRQEPPSTEQPQAPPRESATVFVGLTERLGGAAVPLAATALAFLIGGLVVVITGGNPLTAYRAIFEGTGLNYVFPWLDDSDRARAARNLQQTLILATPLMLTGLAVAFAFRCGLFNIGGQGQYWVGFIAALWIGTNLEGTPRPLHVLLGLVAGIVGGAIWGGIAGILRATVGAHEVITTIMLNWIAIFGGRYLFELGGPLQGTVASLPRSEVVLGVGSAVGALGQHPGASCRHLRRVSRAPRLLRHPQPDDARVRGPCRGVQPRGGALQRDPGPAQLLPRARDLGRVRRSRGGRRRARRQVRGGREQLPGQHGRLHRHRGRPARSQQADRDLPRVAPLRRRSRWERRRGSSIPASSTPSSRRTSRR